MRGTVSQNIILRNILEQTGTMFTYCLDFEKTFDLEHRDSVRLIMKKYGMPKKIIKMVKAIYDDFECFVI